MGSIAYLSIGEFEIDWSKNSIIAMHGELFRACDVKPVPYRYVDDNKEIVTEMREGAARPLEEIVGRLELMGFTLDGCRHKYEALAADTELGEPPIGFDRLAEALGHLDVDQAATEYHTDYDYGEVFCRQIFGRRNQSLDPDEREARFALGDVMEHVGPYVVLRLLAENPANASREVIWGFSDVVEGGWVNREEVFRTLGAHRKFLIVTEGSSDASILKHALKLLQPDVEDFFRFVDMEDGYPFTGTGNLYRFCQGLAGIGIENRVIVAYDNDAEGVAKFRETASLRLPPNMRIMHWPAHESFSTFATVGPQGESAADINGGAAAIECYLDLSWKVANPAIVRWTSYKSATGSYQGELVDKRVYAKNFFELRKKEPGYDFAKLDIVLAALLSECAAMAAP